MMVQYLYDVTDYEKCFTFHQFSHVSSTAKKSKCSNFMISFTSCTVSWQVISIMDMTKKSKFSMGLTIEKYRKNERPNKQYTVHCTKANRAMVPHNTGGTKMASRLQMK